MACKSASLTTYEAGPMLEPCMTLAVILCNDEVCPLYLVRCEWPLSTIQLYTLFGVSSWTNFSNNRLIIIIIIIITNRGSMLTSLRVWTLFLLPSIPREFGACRPWSWYPRLVDVWHQRRMNHVRSTTFLHQRISVAVMRGNAQCVLGTLQSSNSCDV